MNDRPDTPLDSTLGAPRRRRRNPLPSIVGLVALLGAGGWMLYGNLSQSLVYFVTPSEYQAQAARYEGRNLRIGGLVHASAYDPATQRLQFTVTDGVASYPVTYRGAVPDMFQPGSGVVVEGKFEQGTFHGRQLLVKHSEQYRAPDAYTDPADVRRLLEQTE